MAPSQCTVLTESFIHAHKIPGFRNASWRECVFECMLLTRFKSLSYRKSSHFVKSLFQASVPSQPLANKRNSSGHRPPWQVRRSSLVPCPTCPAGGIRGIPQQNKRGGRAPHTTTGGEAPSIFKGPDFTFLRQHPLPGPWGWETVNRGSTLQPRPHPSIKPQTPLLHVASLQVPPAQRDPHSLISLPSPPPALCFPVNVQQPKHHQETA